MGGGGELPGFIATERKKKKIRCEKILYERNAILGVVINNGEGEGAKKREGERQVKFYPY